MNFIIHDKITLQLYVKFLVVPKFIVNTFNDNVVYIFRSHIANSQYSYIIHFCFRGKNVLNQKSELEKALSKHKEKQIQNQVKEHRETPGNDYDLQKNTLFLLCWYTNLTNML